MRIAIWHNLPSGGGKRALYYHVKGLVARGHHVEAWCPPTADRAYQSLAGLCDEHVVPFEWECPWPKAPWKRALWPRRRIVSKLAAMDRHCRTCASQMAAGSFDVLFANSCQFFAASAVGRHAAIPRVLYLQEPYRMLYEAGPALPWEAMPGRDRREGRFGYARRWLKNLAETEGLRIQVREERTNAAAYGRILVNSVFSRESVRRAYGLEASVCYLGVDLSVFHPGSEPSRRDVVIGVGHVGAHKNVEFVIRALAAIPVPRPKLVWVGNSAHQPYLDALRRLAAESGVDFDCRIMVSDAELVRLLQTSLCMAYAPRLEPFGFAPLEAGACGLPVVAVAEAGCRETIRHGETGLLVEPDPALMGAAILRLRGDDTLRTALAARALEWVEREWTWNKANDRLEDFLRRLATPGR